jgi:hypothetical protein
MARNNPGTSHLCHLQRRLRGWYTKLLRLCSALPHCLGDIMALIAATDTYDRLIHHAKLTHAQMVARSDHHSKSVRV